jgi:hypothetical protein
MAFESSGFGALAELRKTSVDVNEGRAVVITCGAIFSLVDNSI